MSTIVTRAGKGSPLTHAEVDANFNNLNSDKFQEGNAIGSTTPAAGTFTTLTGNSTSQFGRSSANYIQATGNTTTNSPEISALGSDTNIPLTLESKGTGAINLAVGSRGVNVSNGQTVTAITRTATGSGYTSIPSVAISAPTTAGGVQAVATATMFVAGATVASGGSGYTVGDVLTVVGGTFSGAATFTVATLSGSAVATVTLTSGGNSYSVLPTNPVSTTGGTGSGATLNITSWGLSTIPVSNAGSGYVEQPTVTFSGGGGSGAAAYATVGSGTTIRSLGSTVSVFTPGGEAVRVAENAGTTTTGMLVTTGTSSQNTVYVSPFGSGASSNFYLYSKGSGQLGFGTNLSVEQLRVAHTASAVNYVQVTGAATGGQPNISTQGSDSTVGLTISSKGTSFVYLRNAGTTVQFSAGGTSSAVNYLNARGNAAGTGPALEAVGTDTNIDLNLTTKGTGAVKFNTGGGEAFRVLDTASAVQRVVAKGGVSGSSGVYLGVASDSNTDASIIIGAQGAGVIRFSTARAADTTLGADQFRVAHTASAVNYVQVTGAATTGVPIISAQGSDTNIGVRLVSKGTGNIAFTSGNNAWIQFVASGANSSVNYLQASGNIASNAPVLSSQGSDTNIDLNLTTKGTGAVKLNTGNGEQVRVADSSGTGFLQISGGTTPYVVAQGSTNANLSLGANGAGTVFLRTSGGGTTQFGVAHTASAVNYVQVTGSATGTRPIVIANGSDANIGLQFQAKGTTSNTVFYANAGSTIQFVVNNSTGGANYLSVFGAATTVSPSLQATGTDTNIDLALTPKGTGLVRFGTRTATSDVAITGYLEIKDSGGTTRKLAIID